MIPETLFYTQEHEWVKIEGQTATIGITDHAQSQLGEITFVELPGAGQAIKADGILGTVESAKAASDIFSPLSGKIIEVNSVLETEPELMNKDCYNAGWLCKLQVTDSNSMEDLMNARQYGEYLNQG
jgi:glycine cleavage system H protein